MNPTAQDYHAISESVSKADPNGECTEEQLLGDVFQNRWLPLHPKFNVVKRVFKFAPELWQSLLSETVFLHYIGAKPWLPEATRHRMDWDVDGYSTLEQLWWDVRRNHLEMDGETLTARFVGTSTGATQDEGSEPNN